MQIWNVLHAASWNTGRKSDAKTRHLGTIVQLCQAISSQLRHVLKIGKKLVKQQYLPHMSLQYGELRPTSGWDPFVSLGHPSKFQRLSRHGSVTARYSSSGRQSNFAALNRGRQLYSAGRPSRWASAHILVVIDAEWKSNNLAHISQQTTYISSYSLCRRHASREFLQNLTEKTLTLNLQYTHIYTVWF